MFNLRYPGQYSDVETGTFYNHKRDYDPSTGRYIQSDPIGLEGRTFSTYEYANSRPLELIDPSGLAPCAGGVWDEDTLDGGGSLAAGGYFGVGNVRYTCRSDPSTRVEGNFYCIGGGPMVAIGAGLGLAGTARGAYDSDDLAGWQTNQAFISFAIWGWQADLNNGGGSVNIGKGVGGGAAYGSCHVRIKVVCPKK